MYKDDHHSDVEERSWKYPSHSPKPHSLYNSCLENHLTVRIQNNTNLQQTAWYCRSVFSNLLSFKKNEINKRSFLKLSFAKKGLDAINLGNVIHHKSVKYKIPLHFIDQSIRLYHTHLQQNTRSWCMVSILKISSLNLLIAPVQVPHSYIICLATF
jgi:hypothetical protein